MSVNVCLCQTKNPASDICVSVFKPQTTAWFGLQGQTSITPLIAPHLFQPNASIFSAISLLTPCLTHMSALTHQQSTGLSRLIPKGWTSSLQTLITHCRVHHLDFTAVSPVLDGQCALCSLLMDMIHPSLWTLYCQLLYHIHQRLRWPHSVIGYHLLYCLSFYFSPPHVALIPCQM